MDYEVFGRRGEIDFGATGIEEVLQNVRTFLCTPRFSVVLDRDMGIDGRVVDRPIPKAQAMIREDIFRNLPLHEPRARAVRIDFSGDGLDGVLAPKVKVRVNLDGA